VKTEIVIDSSGTYYEVVGGQRSSGSAITANGQTKKLVQAQISLNDCLACRYVFVQVLLRTRADRLLSGLNEAGA
jgi:hypothetical protein